MFTLDEILFNKASERINEALLEVNIISDLIQQTKEMDAGSEFCSNINSIYDDMRSIYRDLFKIVQRAELTTLLLSRKSKEDVYINDDLSDFLDIFASASQTDSQDLFNKYLEHPESLTEVEKKKLENMLDVFEKYGITDENEIDYLLLAATASGCGHVLITNMLCDLYQKNHAAFEKKFGYPLYYTVDGETYYNYESLFVDIFLQLNHSKIANIVDTINDYSAILMLLGNSVYDTDIKFYNIESAFKYFLPKNTKFESFQRDASIETYNKYIKKGYNFSYIAVYNFDLIPYGDNSSENTHVDGGHWMQIVGVTEDGHYIVSSWNQEWILDDYSLYYSQKKKAGKNDGGLIFFKVGDIK